MDSATKPVMGWVIRVGAVERATLESHGNAWPIGYIESRSAHHGAAGAGGWCFGAQARDVAELTSGAYSKRQARRVWQDVFSVLAEQD